jgi:hypothetical protein
MRKTLIAVTILVAVAAMLPAVSLASMSSASYSIPNDVIGGGGNTMSSASYTNSSTLGQSSPLGTAASAGYTNYPGFWQGDECVFDPDADGLANCSEYGYGTDPYNPDTDTDGLTDGEEVTTGLDGYTTDPLNPDMDTDGLTDGEEYANNTNPKNPDTDGDGLTDGDEVNTWGTLATNWDTDGDYIPDLYEANNVGNSPPLDPLDVTDGNTNFELTGFEDNNPNFQEYWNQTDPWTFDPSPNPLFPDTPGCYYWGEGDGDGISLPADRSIITSQIIGINQPYSNVIPRGRPDVQDLDGDGLIQAGDLTILRSFILNTSVGIVGSRAAGLELVYEPAGDVVVGGTAHVTVKVHNSRTDNVIYQAGFSVLFSVNPSSTGSAVLLGGDGHYNKGPADNRFSVSHDSSKTDGGHANIAMKITGPGTIIIDAVVPQCGDTTGDTGKWVDDIVLSPPIILNAVNP